jgi:thioesterase domain-containing protein/acyl carrier protein
LTPSGKIDRQALPNPEKQPSEQDAAFVPPRDAMEETIASIWAKILRVERLGLHDDFFELGGHSLTAVRMLYEIRKATGRNLPLATLLRASTVQALAAVMREDKEMGWTSLVPMQPQGNKPPLFLVHGAEGNVLLYRPLLRHLEPDQPVFGLQSQGLNGEAPEHTTIPAMASHYVQEILTIQPDGPYYLAGYCLGGSIAYETARQLTAIGKRVELVGLIESHNSNFERHSKIFLQSPRHFLQNLWFHFANAWSLGPRERPLFLHEKIDIEIGRLRQRLRAAWFGDSQAEKTAFPHLALKKMNDAAAKNYRPLSYRGRVAVIRPKAYFAGLASPSLGWDESVEQGVEIYELPVYPKGMLVDPFCRSLARTLTQCMRRAREADNAPVVSASQPAVD